MTRRRARPPAHNVAAGTLALFLAVFALLVFQLRNGRDPALGRAKVAGASRSPAKRVLIRKVIVTRVIVHLPAEADDRATAVVTASPSRPVTAAPAAPAPRVPVPTAPAPAPAPAPLVTHSS